MRASVLLSLLASLSSINAQTSCPTSAPNNSFVISASCGSFEEYCPVGTVTLATAPAYVRCPIGGIGSICTPAPLGPPYSVQSCDMVTFHFGDGTPDATVTGPGSVTHTYTRPGLYQQSVRIANALGTASVSAPIIITPPSPAFVAFVERPQVTVPDTAGSVTLMLQRSGNLSLTSTVNWKTMCTECGALQPGSGTVTFAPGETTKTFTLAIHDDHLWTGDVVDGVEATADDGTVVDGGILGTWTQVKVVETDPPSVASIHDVTVSESAGSAHFTVHLSAPLGLNSTMIAYTGDGTAVAGVDYILPPNRIIYVNFPVGATDESFDIPIIDHQTPQPDKTFTVQIDGLTGALSTVARQTATCTILSDHFLAPAILQVPVGQSAPLQFEAGSPFAAATTIPVAVNSPSIARVPAAITIPAGSATGTINVAGLRAGSTTVGVQVGNVTSHATVVVFDAGNIVAAPPALTLRIGEDAVVALSIAPAATVAKVLTVTPSDPTLLDLPTSVVVPAGTTAELSVHALRAGTGSVAVTDGVSGATASISVDVVASSRRRAVR